MLNVEFAPRGGAVDEVIDGSEARDRRHPSHMRKSEASQFNIQHSTLNIQH
jgi:hypothetical protein